MVRNVMATSVLIIMTFLFSCCNDSSQAKEDGGTDAVPNGDSVSDGSIGKDASTDGDTDVDAGTDGDTDSDADTDADAGMDSGDVSPWAVRIGGPDNEMGVGVVVLDDGSSIVTGNFGRNTRFGEGDPNEIVIKANGVQDVFFTKYTPDGVLVWIKTATSGQHVIGSDISGLDDGHFVSTGNFNGIATFGKGETNQTVLMGTTDFDIYIAAYNPDGTLEWAQKISGNTDVYSTAIDILPDRSSITTGYYDERILVGTQELLANGNINTFVTKYDFDGNFEWVENIAGQDVYSTDIAVLGDGSSIVTGTFVRKIIFNDQKPGELEINTDEDHLEEIFIAKYDPDGGFDWVRTAVGVNRNVTHKIAVLDDDSFLVTGHTLESILFNVGEADETELVPADGVSMFVVKYHPDGSLEWVFQDGENGFLSDSVVDSYPDGSFIVTGDFSDDVVLGSGEQNETTLTSAGRDDIFIARYNSDRTLAWAVRAGGADINDWGLDVAAVDDGAAIVTGTFTDVATFFPDEPHEASLNSAGNRDIFLMRIGH